MKDKKNLINKYESTILNQKSTYFVFKSFNWLNDEESNSITYLSKIFDWRFNFKQLKFFYWFIANDSASMPSYFNLLSERFN